MQRLHIEPHAILQPYVNAFWTAERSFEPPNDTFDLLPDAYVELVWNFGGQCQIDDGVMVRDLPRCYVIGLLGKPLQLRGAGVIRTVAARCWAWGLAPLLGVPIAEQSTYAFDGCWHDLTDQIERTVMRDNGAAAIDVLQNFLVERVRQGQFDPDTSHAARRLHDQNGQVNIADLADQLHLSPRQLERQFNASVGIPPKALARTMRFEQVRNHLWHDPAADVAALAHDYGYADQAHLIREFRHFSDRTPRQWAQQMRALRDWFHANDVAFVQD